MGKQYRISLHFLSAFARLSSDDQRKTVNSIEKTMTNPARSGTRMHKIGAFYSISPNMDLRVIACSSGDIVTLLYVDHHDAAYAWVNRHHRVDDDKGRLLAVIPLPESQSTLVYPSIEETVADPRFSHLPQTISRWLSAIRDDESLLDAISALSPEYQEAALAGAAIESSDRPPSDVFVLDDDRALRDALAFPLEAWRIFLHPRQRHLVTMPNDRHVLVRGGPGTGKTISLIHRYVHLSRTQKDKTKIPLLVTVTESSRDVIQESLRKLGIALTTNDIFIPEELGNNQSTMEKILSKYSSILIDEGQDLPVHVIANLLALLERDAKIPPIMIAFDNNQSLISASGSALQKLAKFTDIITLNYCYRSTRQLVDRAQIILNKLHDIYVGRTFQDRHAINAGRDAESARLIAGLSGPSIEQIMVSTNSVIVEAQRVTKELLCTYDVHDVAVVAVRNARNTVYGRENINLYSQLNVRVLDPWEAKGREYLAGVVIDFIDHELDRLKFGTVSEARYRSLSGLYVALTRFRDQVRIITTSQFSPLWRTE